MRQRRKDFTKEVPGREGSAACLFPFWIFAQQTSFASPVLLSHSIESQKDSSLILSDKKQSSDNNNFPDSNRECANSKLCANDNDDHLNMRQQQ